MEKGLRVIVEQRIKDWGSHLGWVLFFSDLIALVFVSQFKLLLEIDMLLIIAGLLILKIRPRWR